MSSSTIFKNIPATPPGNKWAAVDDYIDYVVVDEYNRGHFKKWIRDVKKKLPQTKTLQIVRDVNRMYPWCSDRHIYISYSVSIA